LIEKIVEIHSNYLQVWLNESENELNELKQTTSWIVFSQKYGGLVSLIDVLFKEVIPKLKSTAEQIQSILYSPYERLSIEFPQEIKITIFKNIERRITYTKSKIKNSINFYPDIEKVEKQLDRILQSLENEPVRIIKAVRSDLQISLEVLDDDVKTLEKVIASNIPDTEMLLDGYRKIAESKYYRNMMKQFRPNQLSVKLQSIDGAKQVIEDFRRRSDKVYKFEFNLEGILGYELKQLDVSTWYNEKITTDELDKKEKEIQDRINLLVKQIDEIIKIEKKSLKMETLLAEMNPEFPVNLARIAELIEEEKTVVEESLIYTLNKHPEIGKYDSMSQMLVFSGKTTKERQKKEKKIVCPKCKSELKNTESKCPKCGKEFEICPICRGIIVEGKTLSCNSCGRLFHKEHLEEWTNTNRNCPVCKKKI